VWWYPLFVVGSYLWWFLLVVVGGLVGLVFSGGLGHLLARGPAA
jgi:hypothetical protein